MKHQRRRISFTRHPGKQPGADSESNPLCSSVFPYALSDSRRIASRRLLFTAWPQPGVSIRQKARPLLAGIHARVGGGNKGGLPHLALETSGAVPLRLSRIPSRGYGAGEIPQGPFLGDSGDGDPPPSRTLPASSWLPYRAVCSSRSIDTRFLIEREQKAYSYKCSQILAKGNPADGISRTGFTFVLLPLFVVR